MVFVDRKAKYPGRWTMKKSDGTSEVVTLVRNDEPEVEGTPMNAETLNTLSDVAGADVARFQAEAARDAAAGSATKAAGLASAAEKSKTAAATSEANAAKHEEAAKKAADEAGAKAGTDKTLSIENAPADAKVVGDKFAILDPKKTIIGNPVTCTAAAGYPLKVTVEWKPTQEGSGDPSPENIRAIAGRESVSVTHQEADKTITLTLPHTIYGGTVDVVTGEGQETWKLLTLDGTEPWKKTNDWNVGNRSAYRLENRHIGANNELNSPVLCSSFPTAKYLRESNTVSLTGSCICKGANTFVFVVDDTLNTVNSWKDYLAAQFSKGTPVRVAFIRNESLTYISTGAQPIPALSGVNTVLTDADSVTVGSSLITTDVTLTLPNVPADAAATRALIKELLAQQREEDYARIKFWASNDPTSPASFIGGTWERIEGKFIMGASDTYPAGSTGGSATHTQTVNEIAKHNVRFPNTNSGSGITVPAGGIRVNVRSGFVENAFTFPTEEEGNANGYRFPAVGNSQPMSILNPYYSIYIWHRVA